MLQCARGLNNLTTDICRDDGLPCKFSPSMSSVSEMPLFLICVHVLRVVLAICEPKMGPAEHVMGNPPPKYVFGLSLFDKKPLEGADEASMVVSSNCSAGRLGIKRQVEYYPDRDSPSSAPCCKFPACSRIPANHCHRQP